MDKIIEFTIEPTKISKREYDIISEHPQTYKVKNGIGNNRILKRNVYKLGFYKLENNNHSSIYWVKKCDLKQFNQLCINFYEDKLKTINEVINTLKKE